METKEYQLPKEFAEKWVKALRSGEYGQTQKELTDCGGSYCCLGVACSIEGIEDSEMSEYNDTFFTDTSLLTANHFEGKNDLVQELVDMNDYRDKSFPEIADWIEQNIQFI